MNHFYCFVYNFWFEFRENHDIVTLHINWYHIFILFMDIEKHNRKYDFSRSYNTRHFPYIHTFWYVNKKNEEGRNKNSRMAMTHFEFFCIAKHIMHILQSTCYYSYQVQNVFHQTLSKCFQCLKWHDNLFLYLCIRSQTWFDKIFCA